MPNSSPRKTKRFSASEIVYPLKNRDVSFFLDRDLLFEFCQEKCKPQRQPNFLLAIAVSLPEEIIDTQVAPIGLFRSLVRSLPSCFTIQCFIIHPLARVFCPRSSCPKSLWPLQLQSPSHFLAVPMKTLPFLLRLQKHRQQRSYHHHRPRHGQSSRKKPSSGFYR